MLIIDGHVHTYPNHSAKKVIYTFTDFHQMEPTASLGRGTLSDLLEKMRENNINYAVTANFAPRKNAHKTNQWSLAKAQENPSLIPLVCVSPETSQYEISELFEAGAKGIKMHNGIQNFEPADEALTPIYRYCEDYAIPITFHCGETSRVHINDYTEMSHILPVIEKYPGIPFVLTHLASGDPDSLITIANKHPNALFDTSITFSGEHCIYRIHDKVWENDSEAVALFREIGVSRITFGSDYPFGNPGKDIQRILSLKMTDEEKQMILGKNIARIYRV